MAGQKTINIVYNVDSKSIQAATSQVTAAKQATDQLNQSTQKLGQDSASSLKNFQSAIGFVRTEMQQMKELIEQTNRSDVDLLNQRIQKYQQLKKEVDDFDSKLKQTGETAKNVSSNFTSLYNTVRAVVTAGILKEVITTQLELAKLAGQVEGVKRAFNTLPNATILMDQLRAATHGTVDDLALMQQALRAQSYKIPLQNLATLLEYAATRAQQTGQEVNHLVDYIVSGIGLRSIRRLDDLGFTGARVKEALGGVTLQAASMGQVMDAVTKLMNEDLKKTGGYLKTSETDVKNLERAFKDLKVTLSEKLGSSGLANFLTKVFEGAREAFRSDADRQNDENNKAALRMSQDVINKHKDNKEAIDKEILSIKELIKANENEYNANKKNLAESKGKGGFEAVERYAKEQYALQQRNAVLKEGLKILTEYQKQLIGNEEEKADPKGYLESLNEQIKNLQEQIPKQRSVAATQQIMEEIRQLENLKNLWMALISFQNKALTGLEGSKEAKSMRDEVFKDAQSGVLKFQKWLLDNEKDSNKIFLRQLKADLKEQNDAREEAEKRRQRLISFTGQQLFQNARQIANELTQVEVQRLDDQINATREYYNNQIYLAGDNTKAQKKIKQKEDQELNKLEKQRAEAQKKANIRKVEIDTAANIIRSILENGGIPWGLPFGGIAAAMGAFQIAAINGFAEGVIDLKGPGTTKSDSIPSMLSRGESVMTAEETQNSMNILKSIRAKKLNDKVLEKLVVTAPQLNIKADNRDVVEAIRGKKHPDLVRHGSVIYEAKEESKNMRRLVRSKSFSR